MPQCLWHTLEPLSSCPSVTKKKGFPSDSDGKEPTCNAGDPGLIPGSGISPEEANGYQLQYSCLENPMDRGAQKSGNLSALILASLVVQTVKNLPAMQGLSLGWEDPLEKGRATRSRTLASRSPWTKEPGGLQSMELQRITHY